MTATVTVVSADPEYASLVTEVLRDTGYETVWCAQGHLAHEVIRREQPSLVLLDVWLEHPRAGDMVLGMLHIDPATSAIPVITCPEDRHTLAELQTHLADTSHRLLLKPFSLEELLMLVASFTVIDSAVGSRGS